MDSIDGCTNRHCKRGDQKGGRQYKRKILVLQDVPADRFEVPRAKEKDRDSK